MVVRRRIPEEFSERGSGTGIAMPAGMHTTRLVTCLCLLALGACAADAGGGNGGPSTKSSPGDRFGEPKTSVLELVGEQRSVEEFMADLPVGHLENYVLMEQSMSRHRSATVDQPRIIMYGTDARRIVGVATNPEDENYHVVETAELTEDGTWKFAQIDFSSGQPVVDLDESKCTGCHGAEPRPIWGAYPNWPGAFQAHDFDDDLEDGVPAPLLTEAQVATLLRIRDLDDPAKAPRLSQLRMPDDPEVGRALVLPSRPNYPSTNAAFTADVGAAVVEGIMRRLRRHPEWHAERRTLAYAVFCEDDTEMLDATLKRMGHSAADFRLDVFGQRRLGPLAEAGDYGWERGDLFLYQILGALVFDELYVVNEEVRWNMWLDAWFHPGSEHERRERLLYHDPVQHNSIIPQLTERYPNVCDDLRPE